MSLPLVLLFLVGLTALTLVSPRLAVVYVFFSFSFEQLLRTRAPDVVSTGAALLPPIRFSQVVTLLLFGILLLKWLHRARIPRPGWAFWLFTGYVTMNLGSLAYTVNPGSTLRQLTIILLAVITALTFNYWTRDREQARLLVKALCYGAALQFAWSLLQLGVYVFFGLEVGYYAPGVGEHLKIRTFGWMFEPNWLGVLIVAVFPWFLVAFDYSSRFGIRRGYAFIGMGLLLVTLVLNMSRFAWFAVAVQLLLWALISFAHVRRYARRALKWSLPALVLLPAAWFLTPPGLRASIIGRFVDLSTIGAGRGSAAFRVTTYNRLLALSAEEPWLGFGAGTWGALTGALSVATAPTTTYLYILVEVGVIGLAFFTLGLCVYLLRLFLARRGADPQMRLFLTAALLSTVGVFLAGWFVDVKSILAYFPVFGFYFGLLRLSAQRVPEVERTPVATLRLNAAEP